MIDRTLSSRFECKYLVDPAHVPALRTALAPFMRPDRHAASCPGGRYTLSSLYLDSPRMSLYGATVQGLKNRYKLRIRSYDDDPKTPVFFEIKRRADQVVLKRRAGIDRERALRLLAGESVEGSVPAAIEDFVQRSRLIGAVPMVRVRYAREPYESRTDDPVRVTFDTELANAVTLDANLGLGGAGWSETRVGGVVLEIKFTDRCPFWVTKLVHRFRLRRCSVPKYILSVDQSLEAGRLDRHAFPVRPWHPGRPSKSPRSWRLHG